MGAAARTTCNQRASTGRTGSGARVVELEEATLGVSERRRGEKSEHGTTSLPFLRVAPLCVEPSYPSYFDIEMSVAPRPVDKKMRLYHIMEIDAHVPHDVAKWMIEHKDGPLFESPGEMARYWKEKMPSVATAR